jgi:hypothetical protein
MAIITFNGWYVVLSDNNGNEKDKIINEEILATNSLNLVIRHAILTGQWLACIR